jgi:hypothetical protein
MQHTSVYFFGQRLEVFVIKVVNKQIDMPPIGKRLMLIPALGNVIWVTDTK